MYLQQIISGTIDLLERLGADFLKTWRGLFHNASKELAEDACPHRNPGR
jgi:hypothetical protein